MDRNDTEEDADILEPSFQLYATTFGTMVEAREMVDTSGECFSIDVRTKKDLDDVLHGRRRDVKIRILRNNTISHRRYFYCYRHDGAFFRRTEDRTPPSPRALAGGCAASGRRLYLVGARLR